MPAGYDYSLDRSAVTVLAASSAREQRLLLAAFDQLAQHPHTRGDYSYTDSDGRTNEVLDLGGFIVTFWADHAVRLVRVLLIERT